LTVVVPFSEISVLDVCVMIIPEFLLHGWVNYQVITFQGKLA